MIIAGWPIFGANLTTLSLDESRAVRRVSYCRLQQSWRSRVSHAGLAFVTLKSPNTISLQPDYYYIGKMVFSSLVH